MNQYDAKKAILQRWMTLWPAASSNVPYVFDNDVRDESATYARVRIIDLPSEQWTLGAPGNRKFQRTGDIEVELKGPGNVGSKQLDQLTSAVRSVFESVRFGVTDGEQGVTTFASSSFVEATDGQYWILVITTPFEYYEVR